MAVLVQNRLQSRVIDIHRIETVTSGILEYVDLPDCEMSILLVDDSEIQDINRRYLGKDYATNVISFPMAEGECGDLNTHMLGDVVVSVETARRDAERAHIPVEDIIDYFLIHGLCHLLGYDHEQPGSDVAAMVKKEDEIFFALKGYVLERL